MPVCGLMVSLKIVVKHIQLERLIRIACHDLSLVGAPRFAASNGRAAGGCGVCAQQKLTETTSAAVSIEALIVLSDRALLAYLQFFLPNLSSFFENNVVME